MKSEILNQKSKTRQKPNIKKLIGIADAKNMPEALKKAYALAKKGDTVLLSPGAASFGLFKNEFDRGAQFVKAMRSLIRNKKTAAAISGEPDGRHNRPR